MAIEWWQTLPSSALMIKIEKELSLKKRIKTLKESDFSRLCKGYSESEKDVNQSNWPPARTIIIIFGCTMHLFDFGAANL